MNLSTNIWILDDILSGGIALNKITAIIGGMDSGKSSLSLTVAGVANMPVLYFDCNNTFDSFYANSLGYDVSNKNNLTITQNLKKATEIILDFIKNKIECLLVIDGLDALFLFKKDLSKKDKKFIKLLDIASRKYGITTIVTFVKRRQYVRYLSKYCHDIIHLKSMHYETKSKRKKKREPYCIPVICKVNWHLDYKTPEGLLHLYLGAGFSNERGLVEQALNHRILFKDKSGYYSTPIFDMPKIQGMTAAIQYFKKNTDKAALILEELNIDIKEIYNPESFKFKRPVSSKKIINSSEEQQLIELQDSLLEGLSTSPFYKKGFLDIHNPFQQLLEVVVVTGSLRSAAI